MTPLPKERPSARTRTVRQLLGRRYAIGFYQREYVWKERQVRELVHDLSRKFLASYHPDHSRGDVEGYRHYFLGSIVTRGSDPQFIVDGQQRLTTLTMLLIHLDRLQECRGDRVDVRHLVFSEKYGRKTFNLDVADRRDVMRMLVDGKQVTEDGDRESARNIAARYKDIEDHLPEQVTKDALPYFLDWLLENVHLVEIGAPSIEDAYTIFETMNDRGLSLSPPELLKGYVLANVAEKGTRQELNATWKKHIHDLKQLDDESAVSYFFRRWLRARHARTNRDYERISGFHRWVRDEREHLRLTDSDAFVRFVRRDLDFYARCYVKIRQAARKLTPRWESIRYNANRNFALQTQVLLASLAPGDDDDMVEQKVALVADYLDIWLAHRAWNYNRMGNSSVRPEVFRLMKKLRTMNDVDSLSQFLRERLGTKGKGKYPMRFKLTGRNYRQVKHILARLTDWVEVQCGCDSRFNNLAYRGRSRPFEIEHIWSSHYDRFKEWFEHAADFEFERDRLGGLLLIPVSVNQSIGGVSYENKRDTYLKRSDNLLAQSLHPDAYENDSPLLRLRDRYDLPLRPYDSFGPEQQKERQELYVKIAKHVWNSSRLELDAK